ncbi:hypothetical protein NFI96_021118, partial [Prochilodus magdalenae]
HPVHGWATQGSGKQASNCYPALTAFHRIIYKSVLCAKLCGKMKGTMDTMMKLVKTSLGRVPVYSTAFFGSAGGNGHPPVLRQSFTASADGKWIAEVKRLLPPLDEASLQMGIVEKR